MAIEPADIRKLVDVPQNKEDGDLQPFIAGAHLIVTEDLVDKGLSTARLAQIELYLAAHFTIVGVEHGGIAKYEVDQAVETYKNITPSLTGLASTHWGQQALALDTSGTLAGLTASNKAMIDVIPRRDLTRNCTGW